MILLKYRLYPYLHRWNLMFSMAKCHNPLHGPVAVPTSSYHHSQEARTHKTIVRTARIALFLIILQMNSLIWRVASRWVSGLLSSVRLNPLPLLLPENGYIELHLWKTCLRTIISSDSVRSLSKAFPAQTPSTRILTHNSLRSVKMFYMLRMKKIAEV